jgi:hypothetical protein
VGVVGAVHRGVVVCHPLMGRFVLGHRVAHVAGHGLSGAVVAALLDPAAQVGNGGLRRVEGDARGLGNGVRVDRQYAWPATERVLDDRLL